MKIKKKNYFKFNNKKIFVSLKIHLMFMLKLSTIKITKKTSFSHALNSYNNIRFIIQKGIYFKNSVRINH